jgi:hypothetical protein
MGEGGGGGREREGETKKNREKQREAKAGGDRERGNEAHEQVMSRVCWVTERLRLNPICCPLSIPPFVVVRIAFNPSLRCGSHRFPFEMMLVLRTLP